MDVSEFYKTVGGWLPYGASSEDEADHQVKMWDRLSAESPAGESDPYPLTFLRASVGSGKTEAVVFPCLSTLRSDKRRKRIFLVYPTRSLVDDQIQRLIARDGYLQRFARLSGQTVSANIDTGPLSEFWKIEHDKRTCYQGRKKVIWTKDGQTKASLDFPYSPLYNADIILTTFDKFIFRFFGYGKRRWSYIFPFRAKPDLRPVTICFDEAHLYDSASFTNFRNLVDALISHGVQAVIMSATLPSALIEQTFPFAKPREHFVVDGFIKGGDRVIEWQSEKLDKQHLSLKIKELLNDVQPTERKRIVIANTVEEAYLIHRELEKETENLFFYHGRQLTETRTEVYRRLRERDKANEPYTLVTTNAIEVGCDLSADLLITEICNPDQLIQRMGRCARKSGKGRVFIVGDKVPGWMRDDTVNEDEYHKVLHGFTSYSKNSAETVASVIRGAPLMDMRVEMLFGALYDFVYEGDISHLPLYKAGFVITRSWVPSATLYFVDDLDADWHSWHRAPSLSVSLEYLSAYKTSRKNLSEIEQAQLAEDSATAAAEREKPIANQKVLAVPFRTNPREPTMGVRMKDDDFRVYISLEKSYDYEENWVRWDEYRASNVSAYEHELAVVLRQSDFPDVMGKGLVQKLKLFEREYQTRRQRIQIAAKFGNGRERRLWYLQGE